MQYRYAPGKWTIKEIVNHLSDDERIYVYRALRFARSDDTELPGFDQETFAQYSRANERSTEELLEEFSTVRSATLSFFGSLDEASLMKGGVADGQRWTVRGLAYHLAGHELHHMDIVRRLYMR